MSQAEETRARAAAEPWLVATGLVAGTLLLYAGVARHGFIRFDDNEYVTANGWVQRGLSWDGLAWAFTTFHASNWHPLTWLSHMLDVELFGMNAGAHHVVNAALHAVNAALLFGFLARATGSTWRSAAVAALFAVHPLHVESVAWVAERKDVLSTLFGLAALHAYLWHAARPRAGRAALVAACFALSLLAKPMWVTLPFLLALLDVWPLQRVEGLPALPGSAPGRFGAAPLARLALEKLPLLALAAASSAITLVAQGRGGSLSSLELGLGARLGNAAVAYVEYAWKTAWPRSLAIFYPHPREGLATWKAIAAAAALAAVTAAAVRAWRRWPWIAIGWGFFLGTLVPVIGIVQAGAQAMADRYTYLPIVGLFVAAVWSAAEALPRTRAASVAASAVAAAILVALSVATAGQLRHWSTHEALFRHALEVAPDAAVAHGALAEGLRADGRLEEALQHAREAVRLDPASARLWNDLGVSSHELGQDAEAQQAFERALALDPGHASAWTNLGELLQRLGDRARAGDALARAAALAPDDAESSFRLGVFLMRDGRADGAIRAFEQAVRVAPAHFGAATNLAVLYEASGRTAEASATFEAAARAQPGNWVAWRNLGIHLARVGRLADAASAFRQAVRIEPGNADLLHRLGLALAAVGIRDEALGTARLLDALDQAAAADVRARLAGAP